MSSSTSLSGDDSSNDGDESEIPNAEAWRFGDLRQDQLVGRSEDPGQPLYVGTGGSVYDAKTDYSDGFGYTGYDSPARTDFEIEQFPFQDRPTWKRRKQWHDGNRTNWDGKGMQDHQSPAQKLDSIAKKRISEALCDACNLNRGEKEAVVSASTDLEHDPFGQHRGIERVALGLIATVVETRRPLFGADFEAASKHRHDDFRALMAQFGIDYSNLETIKRKVREQNSVESLVW